MATDALISLAFVVMSHRHDRDSAATAVLSHRDRAELVAEGLANEWLAEMQEEEPGEHFVLEKRSGCIHGPLWVITQDDVGFDLASVHVQAVPFIKG